MVSQEDLQGLLIVRLNNRDFQDQHSSNRIRTRLDFIVETANISQLLIDFRDVDFISSETIGQLILLKKKCDQFQIALALCNISPRNMKVLSVVRADEVLSLFENRQSALDALAQTVVPAPSEPMSEADFATLTTRIENGDVDAMFELAQRKAEGEGMPHDAIGAVEWFRKAAERGHVNAQFELATRFAFGLGVEQDYDLAMPWYQKAAEQGHADAQYMIGMTYQFALADFVDLELARSWYEKAAEQGHQKASQALSEMGEQTFELGS